ncbi:unnamed protein product [Cochlearia groenlandica]
MEECRFETSELQASFMMSTPLWSDSWSLCLAANSAAAIQIRHISGIMYVAFPAVEINRLGYLVDLVEVAGDMSLFSGLTASLVSDEPPVMIDGGLLDLFVSSLPHIQSQIKQGLELEGTKQVVITGHSTGGALAALTALWLLSQPSPPSPLRLLCITFGSPLIGNQSLSSSISRSRFAHNFCQVVYINELVANYDDDRFSPFGTYLFCSDNGGLCLDNTASVRRMFLILKSTKTTPKIEEHHDRNYMSTLSHQFLVSRNSFGGNATSDNNNSYQTGVALAVESLGFSDHEPSSLAAKECVETATRIGRAPILRSSELAIELGTILPSRLDIQWYKERCDASPEKLGYYDFFKTFSNKKVQKVNMSRAKLARFWDNVFEMVEKNELPHDFHLWSKWVYASQFYQLLAEPLDIAFFYKYKYSSTSGHYLKKGNRHKRYELIDKWWKEIGAPKKEKRVRTRFASTTQDTCFWAKVEEAKEWLDEIKSEGCSDRQSRSLLWEKIIGFERYANTLVETKEVSKDVLLENSSYKVWIENLKEFKNKFNNGNEIHVVGEGDAMET